MYSKEQLDEKAIEQELFDAVPDDRTNYKNKLDEMLDAQFDDYKFVDVATLKINDKTTGAEIEMFGKMCNGMVGGVKFRIKYNNELQAVRPNDMQVRVDMICSSERWRRQQYNRTQEQSRALENELIKHVDDPNA
jgi:hypothetical protein